MNNIAFLRTVFTAGGILFLCLCASPQRALGQSLQSGATTPAPASLQLSARGKSGAAADLLQGLTLTAEQKTKIDQIRLDTRTRLAAVADDKSLSPEAADAFRRGYARFENTKILEVLTPEQQQQVRKRIADLRSKSGKPQFPTRQAAASEQTSQPQ